jgi:hypothetical protein
MVQRYPHTERLNRIQLQSLLSVKRSPTRGWSAIVGKEISGVARKLAGTRRILESRLFSVAGDLIVSCTWRCVKQRDSLRRTLPRSRDLGLLTRPHSSSNPACREEERPSTGKIAAGRSPNYRPRARRQTVSYAHRFDDSTRGLHHHSLTPICEEPEAHWH